MDEGAQDHQPWRLVPGVLVAAAVSGVALTLLLVPRHTLPTTTHAGASRAAALADATAAIALAVAGAVAWLRRDGRASVAAAAALAALGWVAHDLVGWEGGPPVARSLGTILEPLFLPAVLHLVLAATGPRPASPRLRTVIAAMYAAAAAVGVGRALFRDPFLDPWCWSNCRDNVLLLTAQPAVARAAWALWLAVGLVVGVVLLGRATVAIAPASRSRRGSELPILASAAVLGAATVVYGALRAGGRLERPSDPLEAGLFQVRAWAVAAVAIAVAAVVARSWWTRIRLRRLTSQLADVAASGSLSAELAAATGDTDLLLTYPTPVGQHTDVTGRIVALPTDPARTVTPIVRKGRELAHVVHDPSRVDAQQLRAELGPAALLALENERLQAALRVRLDELRASRTRVVATADEERRRLERDLHDGAQQHLLALSYELRSARAFAPPDGDVGRLLDEALAEVTAANAALRELAHGIHPAILTEAGLAAAVRSLVDTAPIPVVVDAPTGARLEPAVERAAYGFVATTIEAVGRDGAEELLVRLLPEDGWLVVEITGARDVATADLEHAVDRLGAVEGRLVVADGSLIAELPMEERPPRRGGEAQRRAHPR
jgi:signal transduction histidine kinase